MLVMEYRAQQAIYLNIIVLSLGQALGNIWKRISSCYSNGSAGEVVFSILDQGETNDRFTPALSP